MHLDNEAAGKLAEAYSAATGLGCTVIRTPTGETLGACGYTCSSCGLCAFLGVDADSCAHTHMYGLSEAKRFGGRYIYYCQRGLTFYVSPIIGEAMREARVTVGPFLMVDVEDFCDCELDGDTRLAALAREIPFVSPERVTKLSSLLFMATGYLNSAASLENMREQEAIDAIQGQITAYIMEEKRRERAAAYPYDKECALLGAMRANNRGEANRLLNELLGHILLADAADFSRVKTKISALIVVMTRAVMDNGYDPDAMEDALCAYFERIALIGAMPELCAWLASVMKELMDRAFLYRDKTHADAICGCVEYIYAHLNEKLDTATLAARAYLSPGYFGRVFRKEMGVSLERFILDARLNKSAELLRYERLKIAEVAQLSGFQDQSYFTRAFRAAYGVSPMQYRRKFRK